MANAQQTANPFESVTQQDVWIAGDPSSTNIAAPMVEQQIADQTAGKDAITVGAINIDSDAQIPASILANSYEKFIGQSADRETLQQLASAVSDAARNEGYIFASAEIPSQAVKIGVVTVTLDPGAIDEVRIIGSDNNRLRAILDKLVCNAARSEIVERQLLLAGDLPDVTLQKSSYVKEDGKGILIVTVSEKRSRGYAALDNAGPKTLGPVRVRLQLDISGLLTDSDVLTTSVISTITQPSELTYIRARYAMTLGDGGTVVGASASAGRTQSGSSLRRFDLTGHNKYVSIFASQALKRSNDINLWLNGEFGYLEVSQSQNDSLFQKDKIASASVNFSGNKNLGFGRIYGGIGVTQGLSIFGSSSAGDPLNSRSNGSGEFTKANAWVNSIINFGGGFGARVAGNGQIASRPLLSANEIAIGGPSFGRGYDFSERFGDEGVLGLMELRKEFFDATKWLDWFQLYGFVDGGYVSNIGTGFGDGSLASAGGGFRAQIGTIDLRLEAAAPVNEDRFESGDRSPRVNVQVGVRF